MGGVVLEDGVLSVSREPTQLDELAIGFSRVLDQLGIDHVFVAGYVAFLAGRARSTAAVDVLIEPLDEPTAAAVATKLTTEGYWGLTVPLDAIHGLLVNDDPTWITPADQVAPQLKLRPAQDALDRAALSHAITADIGGDVLPISPLELQIAYMLSLGSQTDLEDAVYLHTLFAETLTSAQLEAWVERLGVEATYEQLIG